MMGMIVTISQKSLAMVFRDILLFLVRGTKRRLGDIYRTVPSFLENPQKLWVSGDLIAQKTVLKLAFDEKLRYRKNEGYRTVLTSRPFRFFRLLSADNSIMVRPNGDISNFSDVHEVINTMVEWSQILNNLQQNPLSMNAPVL